MDTDYLDFLHTVLEAYYKLYKAEKMTEEEYLYYIKPIDEAIDKVEITTYEEIFILKRIRYERVKRDRNIPKRDAKT